MVRIDACPPIGAAKITYFCFAMLSNKIKKLSIFGMIWLFVRKVLPVVCCPLSLLGQIAQSNDIPVLLTSISYAYQLPGGDLADRFGSNFDIGLAATWLTAKSDILLGLEGGILFGNSVKEDVVASLRSPAGFIIGTDKSVASVALRERGFYTGALLGKIFSGASSKSRSGIRATLGAGLLQHKVRIQDDSQRVPQLAEPYVRGYDRLTNGLALRQFIGYQFLSSDRQLNFFGGFEFTQAFTQNRRTVNFDTRSGDDTKRLDLLFGIRLAWILPFYFGDGDEIRY